METSFACRTKIAMKIIQVPQIIPQKLLIWGLCHNCIAARHGVEPPLLLFFTSMRICCPNFLPRLRNIRSSVLIFLEQKHNFFHVQLIELLHLLLRLLLLLLPLLQLQLLLLLMKLLPFQETILGLIRVVRRQFGLFLEVGSPVVLDFIISPPRQASRNCWPPKVIKLALLAINFL